MAGQPSIFAALSIAKATLFLRKENLDKNGLYEQITSLLFLGGNKQQGWFPTVNHKLLVEEELSNLELSSAEFSRLDSRGS